MNKNRCCFCGQFTPQGDSICEVCLDSKYKEEMALLKNQRVLVEGVDCEYMDDHICPNNEDWRFKNSRGQTIWR